MALFLGVVPAQAAKTPLFDAFKRFCIDTGARSQAVAAAVIAAGGRQGPPSFLYQPGTYWRFCACKADLTISSASFHFDTGSGSGHEACVIESRRDDATKASLLIGRWVGVAPSYNAYGAQSYRFLVRGDKRLPIATGREPTPDDLKAGRVWWVKLGRGDFGVKAMLNHSTAVRGRRLQLGIQT